MKATFAFMTATVMSFAAGALHLLNDYPGLFTSLAACVTCAAGLHSIFGKRRKR
jgi:hypothetical protein